jgi:hypothetical protein
MEHSQDVVILEVNSGVLVCLFLEREKVQDMIKRLAVSQATKAGGKVLETHRSKKSMTHDETAKGR